MAEASPLQRRLIVLLGTLLGMAITAALGFWQLDRAAQKRALEQAIAQRGQQAPLGNAELRGDAQQLHRRAQLRGHWLADKTVFLDNRPMDGRVGFFVVTPLRLAGRAESLLVQRGWVPRDQADRTRLPALATQAGEVEVEGRLAASPSRLYELGQGSAGAIRQNLAPDAYAAELGIPLLPAALLQTRAAAADDGLLRDWPAPAVDIHKHYGYAFQWFALCALLLGLYVWFQVIRPRRRRPIA